MSDLTTSIAIIVTAVALLSAQLYRLAQRGTRPGAALRAHAPSILGAVVVIGLYSAAQLLADSRPTLARRLDGAATILFGLFILAALWRGVQEGLDDVRRRDPAGAPPKRPIRDG